MKHMKIIYVLVVFGIFLKPSFGQNNTNIIESNNQFSFDIYQKL